MSCAFGKLLYPRLGLADARAVLASRVGLSLRELEALGDVSHPAAAPAATGGAPATTEILAEVQAAIRRVAADAGYPEQLSRTRGQDFDRPCASALYQTMGIVPADAAEEDVWTFLSVVLVPEIAPWRFPGAPEERVLGRPRNVLRRLWWRAWTFGPDLDYAPVGAAPLGEDEFVSVMERSTLAGCQPVARAIRGALWDAELAGCGLPRSELMRELTKRVRATRSEVALEVLGEQALNEIMAKLMQESIEALTASGGRRAKRADV